MKKIIFTGIAALFVGLASCSGNKEAEERNQQLEGEVTSLIATQDSLLSLVNDINEGMSQIKDLERIISTPGALDNETPSRKEQIKNDMLAIRQALQERRERLDALEQQLQSANNQNATLLRTIETLRAQISEQQTEIAQLTNQLAAANIRIEELSTTVDQQNTRIDSLNQSVATETREREIAQDLAEQATNELNTCYYCIGSSSELKKNKILESGFLKKTKVMQSDFNASYFTKADKRTLTRINTNAKKAEVLSNNPKDSYTLTKEGDQMVLNITNPQRFWSLNNYLVIKVN